MKIVCGRCDKVVHTNMCTECGWPVPWYVPYLYIVDFDNIKDPARLYNIRSLTGGSIYIKIYAYIEDSILKNKLAPVEQKKKKAVATARKHITYIEIPKHVLRNLNTSLLFKEEIYDTIIGSIDHEINM